MSQSIENFYIKEGSPILFKYHYIPRNIDRFSNIISDLLNKIEKQHSKHKVIKTEVKEETKLGIKVETKTNDNKSTLENNNNLGKLIIYIYIYINETENIKNN